MRKSIRGHYVKEEGKGPPPTLPCVALSTSAEISTVHYVECCNRPFPPKKNSLLKLRKFSILPFLVKGSPSPSEPCIPTGSSPFPLLPFFALYFPFTHFIATSSIGRCYTAMTNPNQRVCNNQVNQIEIKNIFQKNISQSFLANCRMMTFPAARTSSAGSE